MARHGVKFIRGTVPHHVEATADNKRRVVWKSPEDGKTDVEDVYDTVMLAIGRTSDTKKIGLEALGVATKPNGKIICNDDDVIIYFLILNHNNISIYFYLKIQTTNVEGIYAIGDCVDKRPELTPTAIKAGRLLARRLFNGENKLMDYNSIPTTVFTPLEYGCIGLSEEDAIAKFGEENIKVYYSIFTPLDWSYSDHRHDDRGHCKLVVNKADDERVVGFHYLGPHAGEVTQGFGLAFKLKATKAHFDDTVGIHPTYAEVIFNNLLLYF